MLLTLALMGSAHPVQVHGINVDTGALEVASGLTSPIAVKFNSKGELFALDTATGQVVKVNLTTGQTQTTAGFVIISPFLPICYMLATLWIVTSMKSIPKQVASVSCGQWRTDSSRWNCCQRQLALCC